jgi:hypothetical protein
MTFYLAVPSARARPAMLCLFNATDPLRTDKTLTPREKGEINKYHGACHFVGHLMNEPVASQWQQQQQHPQRRSLARQNEESGQPERATFAFKMLKYY